MSPLASSIDIAEVRRQHPIEDVITASGIELRRSGRGFMGCCPFHEDSTASMSVGGQIPDRFHCFGCGASGDVIDYIQRREGIGFREAVAKLDATDCATRPSLGRWPMQPEDPWMHISTDRAHEIHAVAWEHLTSKVRHAFAISYLQNHRGFDVRALESALGQAVIGHTGPSWTWLTDRLMDDGVSIEELQALDLTRTRSSGPAHDTFHGRLMVPVRSASGDIEGFIGRKVDDNERGPKYRNPTRTTTFAKSQVIYAPSLRPAHSYATAVVVEGPLDALAVAATAAQTRRLEEFWPCSANGTAVSRTQAERVVSLGLEHIVIALDSDQAGAEGTQRWVDAVCRGLGRAVMVTRLPDGLDPADWLAARGHIGLSAFDPKDQWSNDITAPRQAGLELVRAVAARAHDPVQEVVDTAVPLALLAKSPREAAELLSQVEAEMTHLGLDPTATAIPILRRRAMESHLHDRETTPARGPFVDSPPLRL